MGQEYVVMGATLKCSQGNASSKLVVLPVHRVQLKGKCRANIGDGKPFVNVLPFGMCQSMANPSVASATAAAQGVLTPMPCTPVCTMWMGGKTDVLIDNMPALLNSDKLVCSFAGMIEISDSGQ